MSTVQASALEPFLISPFLARRSDPSKPHVLPTPLLDPGSLETAIVAYREAIDALRSRSKRGLPPATRHHVASRVLSFAIFGERDPRALAERTLAHFP